MIKDCGVSACPIIGISVLYTARLTAYETVTQAELTTNLICSLYNRKHPCIVPVNKDSASCGLWYCRTPERAHVR